MSAALETNARRKWNGAGSLMLLCVSTVPILIVGWVSLPTVRFELIGQEIQGLTRLAEEADVIRRRVERTGLRESAESYDQIANELRGLTPHDASAFQIFHSMRESSQRSAFRLDSAQMGSERDLGWNHGNRALRASEVHVVGRGSAPSVIHLVDGVRSLGRPMGVVSLDLSARDDSSTEFDVTAVLETYWSTVVDIENSETQGPVE